MGPAGSPGAHRTPVSFPHPWERMGGMSTQQNSSEPMLQQPLPCHSPVSKHTGEQKACRLSREVCELFISLNTAFLTVSSEDAIAKWKECQGDQDCPQDTRVCCHLWEQTQQAAPEHTRYCETVNLFSVQRETPNNHIKKPHLLIPGGPSKCLSGFLKVLGSEGPTWVSSALSLPVCDWRNRWAEPLCHWIMDLSFYSCISRWPMGPYSRCVLSAAPHKNTTELLGAAHRATTR